MTSFLLAVLASNVFWGIYAVASLVAAITMMRIWGKKELAVLTGKAKENPGSDSSVIGFIMFAVFFVFWPIIAIGAAIRYLAIVFFKLSLGGLKVVLTTTDKVVPSFEVKVGKKE